MRHLFCSYMYPNFIPHMRLLRRHRSPGIAAGLCVMLLYSTSALRSHVLMQSYSLTFGGRCIITCMGEALIRARSASGERANVWAFRPAVYCTGKRGSGNLVDRLHRSAAETTRLDLDRPRQIKHYSARRRAKQYSRNQEPNSEFTHRRCAVLCSLTKCRKARDRARDHSL
jgi:hypothetical protein